MSELLTFAEAAEICGISIKQLKRAVDSGKLSVIRFGVSSRSDKLTRDDLNHYIKACRIPANPGIKKCGVQNLSQAIELSNWPK